MEALTQWTMKNSEICRPQDISALFITSAILNFRSAIIDDVSKKLATSIVGADFQKSHDWLNHVWSLAMLGLVNHAQLKTVLRYEKFYDLILRIPFNLNTYFIFNLMLLFLYSIKFFSVKFLQKLETERNGLAPTIKMKLLNLNGYAQLLANDYKGSLLPADSSAFNVPIAHSKSKQILVNGMLDALKSLLPASNHLKSLHDSKMGFLIG